jgi:phage terminase small subunit
MRKKGTLYRYRAFAKHYLTDCLHNATQAAVAAGYSKTGAGDTGSRLLRNGVVQALLEEFGRESLAKFKIQRDSVLRELARLGFSNMADYITVENGEARIDLSRMTVDQAAAIQEITVEETGEGKGDERKAVTRTKLKLANKREALELLGRHLKLFENEGQQGQGVAVILVDIPRPGGRNLTNPVPALPEKASE